jgi:hypothetical protein
VPLSAAWLDSLAQTHSRFNAVQIARIDSLLRTGYFGPRGHAKAKRKAHLLARIVTTNAYRDLVQLSSSTTTVYEANEESLRDLFANYSDAGLFSAARLEHVRFGLGRVCMRYAVDEIAEGEVTHGGKRLRWRIVDEEIGGTERRLLNLDLPTGTDDVVQVFLAPHHTFAVDYARVEGPPTPYEWFIVHDIEGGWLRKFGTHEPKAYMFWVSATELQRPSLELASKSASTLALAQIPVEDPSSQLASDSSRTRIDSWDSALDSHGLRATPRLPGIVTPAASYDATLELPDHPLVGVRIYIPNLRLRMPVLPDINFDDLREIELPMPILEVDYIEQKRQPSWLRTDDLGFRSWKGNGAVPPAVRRRFPDR